MSDASLVWYVEFSSPACLLLHLLHVWSNEGGSGQYTVCGDGSVTMIRFCCRTARAACQVWSQLKQSLGVL
jgi:hypothetical protein